MTSIVAIRAAAERARGVIRRTPLLSAPAIDALAGRRVLVKAESLQLTGSFKARGAWSAISALPPEVRSRGVLAFSSGNHGQGIAWAAAVHRIPAVVLMPRDAPAVKTDRVRNLGAEVILFDRLSDDRDAIGGAIAEERGLILIQPFDHPDVIAGQGTLGLELAEQAAEVGVRTGEVLVSCGGGGLSAGVALALQSTAPGLTVRTVEPEGFDDMARSLASGDRVANTGLGSSICDAILTPTPGKLTFPILKELAGEGLCVSDGEALRAMALAFSHLRIVVEPGGAVALAAALFRPAALSRDAVIVVASGGNVSPALFGEAIAKHA